MNVGKTSSVSRVVLDASALLALLNSEPGSDVVTTAVAAGASISAVNLAEVVGKLDEIGMPLASIRLALDALGLDVVPFDTELAYATGLLRASTRKAGLALGDRACLALAQREQVDALTTDRSWAGLNLGVSVRVAR